MNQANSFAAWGEVLTSSLLNLWTSLLSYLPQLVGALLVLLVGLLIASVLGRLTKKVIAFTKLDGLIKKTGVDKEFEKIGLPFDLAALMGWMVKWFFIVGTFIAVVDILQIRQVALFLNDVLFYLPNVIVAVVIMLIGIVVGRFVQTLVEKSVTASRLPTSSAPTLGALSKWAILVFALMSALVQLRVATSLIEILFTGFVFMLALAGGLAFGLGGRDRAAKWLEAMERDLHNQ